MKKIHYSGNLMNDDIMSIGTGKITVELLPDDILFKVYTLTKKNKNKNHH